MFRYVLMLVVALCTASCSSNSISPPNFSPREFNKIQIGMSQEFVLEKIGLPLRANHYLIDKQAGKFTADSINVRITKEALMSAGINPTKFLSMDYSIQSDAVKSYVFRSVYISSGEVIKVIEMAVSE